MFQIQRIIRTLFSRAGIRFVHRNAAYLAFAACFAVVMSVSAPLQAQLSRPSVEEAPDQPWQIEADDVGYDDATKQYVAKGNVVIKKRDIKLTADFVRFDSQTAKAVAIGNVVMTAGEDVLVGNSIEINLASETGIIYQASIF